jgi:hypothetical protein
MVAPWETQTGNKVKYTGTRDINTVLTTGVASGVLPDLAGLPGPGQMAQYTTSGALKPLDSVLDLATYQSETATALTDLGKGADGKTYGVFIKAAVKGLIWYNPAVHDYAAAPPTTWDDLNTQAAANKGSAAAIWCLRLGSGAASGWPGTDWIEDIVLRQAGTERAFWMMVVRVELMNLAFSIDSILVAVAMSPKIEVVLAGGILGIVAMRLVVGQLLDLIKRYPTLVDGAFVIIGWVAIKLVVEYLHEAHFVAWTIPRWLSLGAIGVIFVASYLVARRRDVPRTVAGGDQNS